MGGIGDEQNRQILGEMGTGWQITTCLFEG
jgi:hypothetical protein